MTSDDDAEDDDDDDAYDDSEDPLGRGIDSVGWLPSALKTAGSSEPIDEVGDEAVVLPLFPLGGIVYTPNSEHVLNIFEPRYRQMYNDILMNGSKRFVVSMSHPTEKGSFASTGVLFNLEDLKEVSEMTEDRVKYICNHKVTGRVQIRRVLNPEAWIKGDTYLRVEGTIIDDSAEPDEVKEGDAEKKDEPYAAMASYLGLSTNNEELSLRSAFSSLVDLQHDLQEDVRFTMASVDTLSVLEGPGDGSLWNTIRLWQSYAEQRLAARQAEMQKEFQEKLLEFLMKERGMEEGEMPSAVGFQDLSPELQAEVQELQSRMALELRPLVLESTLTMQKLLEAEDHVARVRLLRHFIDAERKRLEARKTLQGVFLGNSGLGSADAETSATIDDDDDDDEEEEEEQSSPAVKAQDERSIFTDEPDAFQ